jgi:hypothetical protein
MNLLDLKKQKNNENSNYYFKRDFLVKNYVISVLNIYDYSEALNIYKPLNNDKFIIFLSEKIYFRSDHNDLAHAKFEALSILDYLENKLKKDFSLLTVSGVKNGKLKMFVADVNLYHPLISIGFTKNKGRVELKGEVILSQKIQGILEYSSFSNIFKPYTISLFPIQLNDKQVLKYGIKIAKKIKQRIIHDTSEVSHIEKTKLSSQLNIPYSISYGTKDLAESMVNLYHHQSQKYVRIKLSKLNGELNVINPTNSFKNLINIIYSCNSSKCRKSIFKLAGILISPFNQIIGNNTCHVCARQATKKHINFIAE